jgi:hypothetical protein
MHVDICIMCRQNSLNSMHSRIACIHVYTHANMCTCIPTRVFMCTRVHVCECLQTHACMHSIMYHARHARPYATCDTDIDRHRHRHRHRHQLWMHRYYPGVCEWGPLFEKDNQPMSVFQICGAARRHICACIHMRMHTYASINDIWMRRHICVCIHLNAASHLCMHTYASIRLRLRN